MHRPCANCFTHATSLKCHTTHYNSIKDIRNFSVNRIK